MIPLRNFGQTNYKIGGLSLKHILYISDINFFENSLNEMGVIGEYAGFLSLLFTLLHNQSSDAVSHKLGIYSTFSILYVSIAYICLLGRLNL